MADSSRRGETRSSADADERVAVGATVVGLGLVGVDSMVVDDDAAVVAVADVVVGQALVGVDAAVVAVDDEVAER